MSSGIKKVNVEITSMIFAKPAYFSKLVFLQLAYIKVSAIQLKNNNFDK